MRSIDPLMPANSAGTVLRSPSSADAEFSAATRSSGTEIPGIFEVASVADGVNDEPHLLQNLALGAFSTPDFVQLSSSCDPHSLQNLSPSGFSNVHRWRRMQSP
jgi:hypothetical protein